MSLVAHPSVLAQQHCFGCIDRFDTAAGACFNADRSERFVLWRNWDGRRPIMAALMLNPSIADEQHLDPTLTRVFRYARAWGFGGMQILNAFSLVSTDPGGLRGYGRSHDPNDWHIARTIGDPRVHRVMVGWGANMDKPDLRDRRKSVDALLKRAEGDVMAWRLTASGQPTHPLRLPGEIDPVPYVGMA